MRLAILLAVLLVACSGPSLETDVAAQSVALPTESVVKALVWGQSNGEGQGTRNDPTVAIPFYPRYLDEHVGQVHFYERLGPVLQDIPLNPAFASALGGISPKRGALPTAGTSIKAGGKNPVFATIARSGTAIGAWGVGQAARTLFDTYADELVLDLGAEDWHIIVIHGESDAQGPVTAAAYQTNLTNWVAHMRVKFPGARVYVTRVNVNCAGSDVTTVRAAQAAFVAADPNAELIDTDSYGFATPHFTDTGLDSLGSAIGARVLANVPATPIVVTQFDGWQNAADLAGGTSNSHDDPRQSGTFQADWTSREPTNGYAMYGTGIDAQARVDAVINAFADRGVDCIAPLIILPTGIYGSTVDADPIRQAMSTPFDSYRASAYKSRLKFIPLLQAISLRYPYPGFPSHPANTTDGGTYLAQWGTYVAGLLSDPQCQTFGVLKAVGMYGTPDMPTAMWNVFKAAVVAAGGPPFVLIDWSHSPSDVVRLGAYASVPYPPNPPLPSGNGQHTYQEMVTLEAALAAPVSANFGAVISFRQDPRPLSHTGVDAITPWVDAPSLPEHFKFAYQQMRKISSGFPSVMTIAHSANEWAEGGQGYEPSKQEDTRALDVMLWARRIMTRPTTYTYSLSTENSLIVKSGVWTMARLLGTTVFDNRTLSSSTTGDTLTFSHINSTAFAIYGDTSLTGGTFNVQVDGGAPTLVSTVGTALHHQQLWSSGVLTEGTHTILVTNVSGTIVTDAIQITCNPRNFPLV